MKRIHNLVIYVLFFAFVGCASQPPADSRVEPSSRVVLIISADNMNASINSSEINGLMKREVSEFCESLASKLDGAGRKVTLRQYGSATQEDIGRLIGGMNEKPGVLIQVYWTGQDTSLYTTVSALRIVNSDSPDSVRFESLAEKKYLSIGLKAKPTDTPEAHAAEFAGYLESALR